jgi:hypothetical protein
VFIMSEKYYTKKDMVTEHVNARWNGAGPWYSTYVSCNIGSVLRNRKEIYRLHSVTKNTQTCTLSVSSITERLLLLLRNIEGKASPIGIYFMLSINSCEKRDVSLWVISSRTFCEAKPRRGEHYLHGAS